jgi:hypothetical protein
MKPISNHWCVFDYQARKYNRYHTRQLDKDVQAWAGGVLAGVTHRIAYNGSFVVG